MKKETLYLDHAATTPLRPEVLAAMMPWFTGDFGNASSFHQAGQATRKAVDHARAQVAKAIGAAPDEIFFTSGATESDNWAIMGYLHANKNKGKHIITTAIEHHAVLETCEAMAKEGFELTILPVDEVGLVTPEQVKAALRPDTLLVTIMFANNEIGTIEPIAEIGKVCRDAKVAFHTDAVQAVGQVPIDVKAMNIDMLSLSAHKFYGPKGIGALYVRKGVRLGNIMYGGAQEKGKRPGTYNHPSIVGLGAAIELATADIPNHSAKIAALRDHLIEGVLAAIPDVKVNGPRENRLPNNANFSFRYIEGESLILSLDLLGIAGSSGSACTSGSLDPSHVLLAIGLPHEVAHGSLRLTLGDLTTMEQIDHVLAVLPGIVTKLRAMSPLSAKN